MSEATEKPPLHVIQFPGKPTEPEELPTPQELLKNLGDLYDAARHEGRDDLATSLVSTMTLVQMLWRLECTIAEGFELE